MKKKLGTPANGSGIKERTIVVTGAGGMAGERLEPVAEAPAQGHSTILEPAHAARMGMAP